ncbi:hypothetical protein F5Y14DRAFT_463767 [Nemania sp. NC0429]|nr:hypothetical protein F5Y14DRAFT_463767 [Nemania sp. NC0429]
MAQPKRAPRSTAQPRQRAPQDTDDVAASGKPSQNQLRLDLPPIANVYQAFKDMLSKRQSDIIAIAEDGGFQLRVGTMCSGTEAPVFALKLINEISQILTNGRKFVEFDHLFSVENEPFKQAYISRNAPGSVVFCDVVDLADPEATSAPTILGDHRNIPLDIDILIAGTSCVDFSSLNTKKKQNIQLLSTGIKLAEEWKNLSKDPLRDDFYDEVRLWLNSITPEEIQTASKSLGESSYTFLSTVCYITRHRPKMVVLENVVGAPWHAMCDFFLNGAGYAATYTLMDTKDYYIPQTRLRGYVVAVDRHVFGASADQIIAEWGPEVNSLRRSASTPMQDWLLSSHDPLAMRARQDDSEKVAASGLNSGRSSQWSRSKLRHDRVRRQCKLGPGRPLTAWGLGGIDQPYDRMDKLVLKGQNDRALDCVDMYYLRCLHAGAETVGDANTVKNPSAGPLQYDIRFKSQIFDLSQNIDRGQISRNFGIAGCLTPRGLNLITNQGRLASGFEALNLQGLPLRDLDLTRESQDELRDLAGNAMTTTVVGAAMFSLLVAVHRCSSVAESPLLKKITPQERNLAPYQQPLYQPPFGDPTSEETWSTVPGSFCNAQQIIDLLKRCRRYCYCNGGAKYSTSELRCCQLCDVTRCKNCAGNPKHQFGSSMSIDDPIMNDMAPQEMMKHFPTALADIIGNAIDHIPFCPDFRENELQDLLLNSLRSATFYYTRVLISETVTICYSATDDNFTFHLQAVISDSWITWYLFLDPWSPCGQLLRKELDMPAAHMVRPFGRVRISPHASSFMPDQDAWEFWVFTEILFDIGITKSHPGSIEITGISLEDLPVATRPDLQSIIGTYFHHPECDSAEDSLHVCTQAPRRFLFKDPTKMGPTQEDCYIISDECRYLEKSDFRDFRVKFLPTWTPQVAEARATVSIQGYWEKVVTNTGSKIPSYLRHVGSRSIPDALELQPNSEGHMIRTLASVRLHSNIIADAYIPLLKYGMNPGSWVIVSRSDYSAIFDLLAPVNVNLSGIESTIRSTDTKMCKTCCPNLPSVHWMEKTADASKKSAREPYRLSHEMCVYEQELRRSGEPLQVAVRINESNQGSGWKEVTANYEVNVGMLVHRAVNHLLRAKDHAGVLPLETFVDITRGSLNIPNMRFESFRRSLQRLPGNGFQKRPGRQEVFINGYALTQQQEVSLNWMLERELSPPSFTEREIEECRVDPLNLRVLAVAEHDTSRPGGILADDVGYGKTVVTLALMGVQREFDQGESLRERCGLEDNASALAASLIFVPKHLVNQWRDEMAKFLGWKGMDVLVIKSSNDLLGELNTTGSDAGTSLHRAKRPRTATLLDEIRAAKVIIVSTSVFDETYYNWLGRYAGSLASPRAIPRTNSTKDTTNPNVLGAFQDWYEDAIPHAQVHLSGFDPTIFTPSQLSKIERRRESLQDSWKGVVADRYDSSTRLGAQTIRNDRKGKSVKGRDEAETACSEYGDRAREISLTKEDFEANKFLYVLEAFSFARVIYDEFSYENFCVAQFVKNAKTRAKWVLSATPPTGNVKAVCDIGELLKVHVVRPVKLRPGLPLITEGPIVRCQASIEKQLSYGRLYTDKSVYERVEQAHKFLRHFASANPYDEEGLGRIKVFEDVICSYMTRRELIKYLDIQRDLRNCGLDVSYLLDRHKFDTDTKLELCSERRLCAGLTLAFVASVDCVDDEGEVGGTANLVANRRRDLEASQQRLKVITDVAIWLILRRCKEEAPKKNISATSIVEDISWHFESILERKPESFGGVEALAAITESTFSKDQFANCLQWLKTIRPKERTSEDYYMRFFTLLNEEIATPAWATYFSLPESYVAGLESSEIFAFLQELDGEDSSAMPPAQARERLRGIVATKQPSTGSLAGKANKKAPRLKAHPQPDILGDAPNSGAEGGDGKKPSTYPRFSARKNIRGGSYTETESELTDIMLKFSDAKEEVIARMKQVVTASNLLCSDSSRSCSACGQRCDDMQFLPECGHFVCSSHLETRLCGQIKSDKYPNGSGCSTLIHKRTMPVHQIDRCTMRIAAPPMTIVGGKEPPKVSSKSWSILDTIKSVLDQSNERVLVFYQFGMQKQELCQLLEYHGIAFETQPGNRVVGSAAAQNSDRERVRILRINSEEAAGSNFQDANHVMFISTPVFAKQEEFEKYVKQAKGRAVRHGQRRDVRVYYFVTANTFEVDLLELRKRSHIRLGKKDLAHFVPMAGDTRRDTDPDGRTETTDTQGASS